MTYKNVTLHVRDRYAHVENRLPGTFDELEITRRVGLPGRYVRYHEEGEPPRVEKLTAQKTKAIKRAIDRGDLTPVESAEEDDDR